MKWEREESQEKDYGEASYYFGKLEFNPTRDLWEPVENIHLRCVTSKGLGYLSTNSHQILVESSTQSVFILWHIWTTICGNSEEIQWPERSLKYQALAVTYKF